MVREDIIQFINSQINYLKKNDVRQLMEKSRIDELTDISDKLDFSLLEEFISDEKRLELEIDEIPSNSSLELAFYISNGSCDDCYIFADYEDFQKLLKHDGGIVGYGIAEMLYGTELRELSIGDFTTI